MNFDSISAKMDQYISPIANKLSQQRHLKAIRDAFMSMLPITLFGSIPIILNAAPVTEDTTNIFLLAWADFAEKNSLALNWISGLTLNAMSLFICMGVVYFLCRHYKEDVLRPMMFAIAGFLMLVLTPMKMGWEGNEVEISFLDGRGILMALFVAIVTVEGYHWMRKKNIGRITMPDSVPASLSETFAALVPGVILMTFFAILFVIFHNFNTTAVQFIYEAMSPSLQAADSLPFTILSIFLIHLFWFFGIHDAALAGILGPIRDGNLSINAAEKVAGSDLSRIFTTPFWTYFVIIGGSGSVLALSLLMIFSRSKQLSTVGKVGFIPSIFGLSEPMIFGTPLMLNPIFFFPFIFTSVFNGIVTYLCMAGGIVGKTFAVFSWQMPAPIGAFLSTMDWRAVVLVILLIVIDGLIYYPFLKVYEKNLIKLESETVSEE
ncbi:PTS sugar transporter subunit IIC [Tetragenococcus halophilus]|uniref:Permease IIC component n=2 Tax=Tetragenococcus halophilus TaxID=51669 RepID=A0AAN1SF34_TETHN|nr:PTS transporter subunit EIIC [Tetragenococcus halophilus]MDN6735862.1 PTS transporter subunit EIIC [Tetragenococcus koreensis]AOF48377.1 PTS lactose transporter subunit IIC [Tetragenococcus halophilus]MCF1685122.1 PTS transporter subunit EIIC [Tetragenococcus halophilus]MCO7027426.1 PTS transporter subunit EIIC [Tetragenococcus halophilus]MCO8284407.1 PTS sugar transporter subunit IIC [Tetragenococcus halophilus]